LTARSKPSRARGTAQRLAPHIGASCCRFLVKSWGTPGKAEGEFHLPHSIWPRRSRQVKDANVSFVGASAPIVTGTTFIFVGDPY
jgi:hypothetical protein